MGLGEVVSRCPTGLVQWLHFFPRASVAGSCPRGAFDSGNTCGVVVPSCRWFDCNLARGPAKPYHPGCDCRSFGAVGSGFHGFDTRGLGFECCFCGQFVGFRDGMGAFFTQKVARLLGAGTLCSL